MKSLVLALLAACLSACLPLGQKLLTLEIQQDDEVLLSTVFDVPDTSTEAEIWDSAGEVPFSTQVAAFEPSGTDPPTADIEGPVQIRILWTDTVEGLVTLDGVRLVRSAADADDWRLPPDEIRRARAAAGL